MIDPKRLQPLSYYLNQAMHPDAKKAITKKLKLIFSMHVEFEIETADYYRYLGVQIIRLQLVTETNKMIMDHIGRYTCLIPWARELWEFKGLCETLIRNTEEMLRSLLAKGISDGHYHPVDTELKPTTAACVGGSTEGSTVQPQSLSQEAL
jgi:hypothetical protein